MNTDHIQTQFHHMGARFQTRVLPVWWGNSMGYAMDIQRDRRGEFFELRVLESLAGRLDINVLQVRPQDRHLLLLVRRDQPERRLDRFLCGHDEREWFVAAVPGSVSSVADAMESLKPAEVQAAQAHAGLNAHQRNRRKNGAFRRQGEWFFIPAPELQADPKLILRDEPIRRGAGKPHLVENLYRTGGESVHVCAQHPNGLTEREYRRLLKHNAEARAWHWRVMRRNMRVYARGTVRHRDHATITLPFWHRVLMNTESQSRAMANVAFLD